MGLIGAAIGLGFVVGPALGGVLAPLGTAVVPFWVAMLVALANALLVLRFLPETRWIGTSRAPVSPAAHDKGVIFAGWRQESLSRSEVLERLSWLAAKITRRAFRL
jgi:MFS family permease